MTLTQEAPAVGLAWDRRWPGGPSMANVRSAVVVFDGDDTLWRTEPLYDRARQDARFVVENEGLDGARWEELQRRLDVANVARFGLSAKRFPTSCREAYLAVCAES